MHLAGWGGMEYWGMATHVVLTNYLPSPLPLCSFLQEPDCMSLDTHATCLCNYIFTLLPKPECKGIGFRQISFNVYILYHKCSP